MGDTRRVGLNDNHWRCRHCGVAFVVRVDLSAHITDHERAYLSLN